MSLSIVVHAECGAFRQEKRGGNRPVLPDGNAAEIARAPDSVCGVTTLVGMEPYEGMSCSFLAPLTIYFSDFTQHRFIFLDGFRHGLTFAVHSVMLIYLIGLPPLKLDSLSSRGASLSFESSSPSNSSSCRRCESSQLK